MKGGAKLADQADQLAYCHAFWQEAVRLYPPAFNTIRSLHKTVTLPATAHADAATIPKDTLVSIPIWQIQRSERNFWKPTEFHPERWVSYDDTTKTWKPRDYAAEKKEAPANAPSTIPPGNPDAFLAFSSGARNCPGQNFAFREAVVLFASIIQCLEFEALPDYVLKSDRNGPVQRPVDGMPLRIRWRGHEGQ